MSVTSARRMKQSGIDWIGSIPIDWEVKRLKFITVFAYGEALAAEARVDGDVPVYGSNGVVGSHHQPNTSGATIIIGRKGSYGKINRSPDPVFAIDTTYFVDKRCTSVDLDWLYYLLGCLSLDTLSKDSAVPGLAREDAYEKRCPVPPASMQPFIARYIERETARFDALINKKRRLLELIEEKRLALVTHAVTKGIDPNVRMKDSGIEWLGEIPAHWKTGIKFQYIAKSERNSFVNGPFGSDLLTSELTDEGVPVLYSGDVREFGFQRKSEKYVTEDKARQLDFCRADPGDLLLAKVGDPPGTACVYSKSDIPAVVTQDVVRIRVDENSAVPQYLAYFLNSKIGRQFVSLISVEATRGRFSLADLKAIRFFLPPVAEQDDIVCQLDNQLLKLRRLGQKLENTIAALLECRSAVILNAVTGKIDVRGQIMREAAA